MAKRLQHRGGTTAQHSTFTGAVREVTVDTDKNTLVVHDGATAGGHPLATATNFQSTGIDDNATSTAVTIDSSERVGILQTSPNSNLHVSSGGNTKVRFDGNSNSNTSTFLISHVASGDVGLQFNSNQLNMFSYGDIAFYPSTSNISGSYPNNEVMRIRNNGNVGIGTTSPSSPLHIEADIPNITLTDANANQVSLSARVNFDGNNGSAGHIGMGAGNLQISHDHAKSIIFYTSNTERMRIDSSGNLGIGTSSPDVPLDVEIDVGSSGTVARISNSNSTYSQDIDFKFNSNKDVILDTGSGSGGIVLEPGSRGVIINEEGGDKDFRVESNNNANMLFVDGGNDRVGIGTSSPTHELTLSKSATGVSDNPTFQITNTWTGEGNNVGFSNRALTLLEAGNGTVRTRIQTRYDSGANLGEIGTETSHDFRFLTGGSERMRIDSTGNVGIGTTAPGSPLTVSGGTNTTIANFNNNVSATTSVSNALLIQSNCSGSAGVGFGLGIAFNGERNDGNTQRFGNVSWEATTNSGTSLATDFFLQHYNGTETFRVKQNGRLVRNSGALASAHGNFIGEVGSSYKALSFSRTSGGSEVGNVVANTSSTSYNTSSDYRLKENIVEITDATTRLKQLKPKRFNFIADADTTVDGFIAHEVSDIVPEAISGTKDETETKEKVVVNANGNVIAENIEQTDWEAGKIADENGNTKYPIDSTWESTKVIPVYQGIDQSKLVPLLVKTIQELEARITALETNNP